MLGGVASGVGNYFKIDPVIVRAAFIILTLFTGGAFLVVYLAMWLLIPTAGSTATQPGQIVQENLDDMGARVRSFTGSNYGNGGSTPANGNGNGSGNGGSTPANGGPNGTNIVPSQANAGQRQGMGPMILILIGVLFLMANFGFFHMIHWGFLWPIVLIGFCVVMLSRRNR